MMAQDNYDEDTEYQFSDEEGEEIYGVETEAEATGAAATSIDEEDTAPAEVLESPPSKRNIIALVLMAILFIFLGYKVYTWIFGEKPTKPAGSSLPSIGQVSTKPAPTIPPIFQQQPKAAVTPGKITEPTLDLLAPAKKPSLETQEARAMQTAKGPPSTAEALPVSSAQLVENLSQQQMENQTRLKTLNAQLSNLQDGVQGVQNAVQHLSVQFKQARQKRQVAARATARTAAHAKAMHEKVIQHHKRYFVDAVIPGRAWLHGADGSSLTVTVGDSVPGYGKVLAIDSYSGTVSMSSGIKIYYGVSG